VLREVLGDLFGKHLPRENPCKYWDFERESEVMRSFFKIDIYIQITVVVDCK
jgi:hypothetical protein